MANRELLAAAIARYKNLPVEMVAARLERVPPIHRNALWHHPVLQAEMRSIRRFEVEAENAKNLLVIALEICWRQHWSILDTVNILHRGVN